MAYPYRKFIKPRLGTPLNKGHRLSKGLVGCWLMNEGCGGEVFDLSGNKNTGTLSGDTAWAAGKHGSCLSFDGNGDYVTLAGRQFYGQFTISALVRSTTGDTGVNQYIFSQMYSSTYPSVALYWRSDWI